ncbi:hypothetical protein H5410_003084 [Solanum commersonii]|uniref:Uncharacterized protein n=1 Tax=Solanum commersonii TaxID=4109 RepID=A0A9J6B4Q1_SOLCO|nr:hypothetical protein H5410_003084 [Solanum commersonii]
MNAHKGIQLTHARINCVLKYSSCDSPLPKNLKLTLQLPMQVQAQQKIKCNGHIHKDETQCIISPIGLPVFSNQHFHQLTQHLKGLFKASNGVEFKSIAIYI